MFTTLLFEYVPLFRQIRYPERFAIFVNLTVAIFAALGFRSVSSRSRSLAFLVVLVALVEHLSVPQFLDELPPSEPSQQVYAVLRDLPADTVVAEVPASRYRMERRDAAFMMYALYHGKRTVEGYTGYFPPLYSLAKWHLFNFPSERSLRFLSDLGVNTLVDRTNLTPPPRVRVAWSSGDARLLRLPPPPPGSFREDSFRTRPELEEIPRDRWELRLPERGDPVALLRDGDPRTAWSTGDGQNRSHFVRVRFGAPERLARIRLFLPLPAEFPTMFRVEGLVDHDDAPSPVLPFDRDWAFASLARTLWKTPTMASMDIDVEPVMVSGFRIRVIADDPFRMPITLSEIRAYRPGPN